MWWNLRARLILWLVRTVRKAAPRCGMLAAQRQQHLTRRAARAKGKLNGAEMSPARVAQLSQHAAVPATGSVPARAVSVLFRPRREPHEVLPGTLAVPASQLTPAPQAPASRHHITRHSRAITNQPRQPSTVNKLPLAARIANAACCESRGF